MTVSLNVHICVSTSKSFLLLLLFLSILGRGGFAVFAQGRATQAIRLLNHCVNPYPFPSCQPPIDFLHEEYQANEIHLSQLLDFQVRRSKYLLSKLHPREKFFLNVAPPALDHPTETQFGEVVIHSPVSHQPAYYNP